MNLSIQLTQFFRSVDNENNNDNADNAVDDEEGGKN